MNDFKIDAELYTTLREIRESVRTLFEQLRLRGENGDVSGKERLERVPALAKRNFANLINGDSGRAIREAWRLVDFLEGRNDEKLTPLAREALRPIELDSQLSRLRASDQWTEAARRLREALGIPSPDVRQMDAPEGDENGAGRSGGICAGRDDENAGDSVGPDADRTPSLRSLDRRRRLAVALVWLGAVGSLALLLTLWPSTPRREPAVDCLPLETASQADLDAHWTIVPLNSDLLPEPDPARPAPIVLTISDPGDGGPIRSVFTTSQFSFDEDRPPAQEGGGKADLRLRVGGWGDTYLSLLKFPLPNDRPARRAVVRLTVLGDDPQSRPTSMTLRMIEAHWEVAAGRNKRLWWRDCPISQIVAKGLPAPGARGSHYDIDITVIYNYWAMGFVENHGIMLTPESIGSYRDSAEHYPNFSTFYSTRAINPDNRPKLILTY